MNLPIRIISTDFDGTLYAEFESPPVAVELELLIQRMQQQGVKWVINTGRDLSSLMESLGRARLSVHPDYVVVVEREIYLREGARYFSLEPWNSDCQRTHQDLFNRIQPDLAELFDWVSHRFGASVYSDAYSPFCLIAESNGDADTIEGFLLRYSERIPGLAVVRNDVYARFSHRAYSKGTALSEITRQVGCTADDVLAAGDHLNDLPMLSCEHARWLVAPANAVDSVKEAVRRQKGFVSDEPHGYGVARGLEFFLEQKAGLTTNLTSKT